MVEMAETSEIIKSATPKSLVIFDGTSFTSFVIDVTDISVELGRGTSTFDGVCAPNCRALDSPLISTCRWQSQALFSNTL